MKARDIMTPQPLVLVPTDEVWKAAEIMRYEDIGCIPVVRNCVIPNLVGLITDRDITIRCVARRHGAGCAIGDHMTPVPLQTVLPDADTSEIVAKMEAAQVRRIPVVDEAGKLVGIVAEVDLAMKLWPQEARPAGKRVKTAAPPALAKI